MRESETMKRISQMQFEWDRVRWRKSSTVWPEPCLYHTRQHRQPSTNRCDDREESIPKTIECASARLRQNEKIPITILMDFVAC